MDPGAAGQVVQLLEEDGAAASNLLAHLGVLDPGAGSAASMPALLTALLIGGRARRHGANFEMYTLAVVSCFIHRCEHFFFARPCRCQGAPPTSQSHHKRQPGWDTGALPTRTSTAQPN